GGAVAAEAHVAPPAAGRACLTEVVEEVAAAAVERPGVPEHVVKAGEGATTGPSEGGGVEGRLLRAGPVEHHAQPLRRRVDGEEVALGEVGEAAEEARPVEPRLPLQRREV